MRSQVLKQVPLLDRNQFAVNPGVMGSWSRTELPECLALLGIALVVPVLQTPFGSTVAVHSLTAMEIAIKTMSGKSVVLQALCMFFVS